jgi:dihydrofolate reductase
MKLTTMTQLTVDGVMQGNGGTTAEDRRNGFERGGWAMVAGDDTTMALINETYARADAFLFGRRTYELFAGSWGAEEQARAGADDPGNNPIGELKAKRAGELQVHGSGALIRWLLERELVDEMILLIVPVVLGQGARLFPDAGPEIALDPLDSRTDSKGVTIQVHRPHGRPQHAG